MEMHAFGRLMPLPQAQRRLLAAARPLARVEEIPVSAAFGRVSAASLTSPRNIPSFYRAHWDGYAIRSRDTQSARRRAPVTLWVVGEVFAEGSFAGRVRSGQAVAIATGGAVPPGADAIVIFEDVTRDGSTIRLTGPVRAGERISAPGSDYARGSRLVVEGEAFTPTTVGAVAACGVPSVSVYARPRVAIVPNGNELVMPGARLGVGEIYESNNAALSAFVEAAGGIPDPRPPAPDDPRRIEASLRRALRDSDVVLATGGSSVGERDYLPRIFPRLGRMLFHGIAVRPGKPTLAARVGQKLLVGLPGHPTSCLANCYWLVLPLLRKLAHAPGPGWVEAPAVLGEGVLAPTPGLATVVPVVLRRGKAYSSFHSSASISSMLGSVGYAVLPPGTGRIPAGAELTVRWLVPPLGPGGPRL